MTNFNKGDRVTYVGLTRTEFALYSGMRFALVRGLEFEVKQVNPHKIRVRRDNAEVWVYPDELVLANPDAPRPRRLGEVPEGKLSPWDPDLMWLWDDVALYATQRNYCNTFDQIMEALGLPGRKQEFRVTRIVAGLTAEFKVQARSKEEAEKLIGEALENADSSK